MALEATKMNAPNLQEFSTMGAPQPCAISTEEEDFKVHSCSMCAKTSGNEGGFMKRIASFHDDHVGRVQSLEIYAQCEEFHAKEYCEPMQRAGHVVSKIDAKQFKLHFEQHCVHPLRSIVEQIHTVENQMRHVRDNGMRKRSGS